MASKDQAKKNAAKAKKSGGLKEYLKGRGVPVRL